MYPFILDYKCMDYIWGGDKLSSEWGKDGGKIAESWELSVGNVHTSTVLNGRFKGMRLDDILSMNPDFLGVSAGKKPMFPLLVKLIDAKTDLSVQVHPDDEYSLKNEGKLGKREMWYVLDAAVGAEIYLGLNRDITKEEFSSFIAENRTEELLNRIKVKRGDCFLVNEGTLHAIRGGITILEIQENSDVTYRVYDYNRLGADGKPRELHVKKAIDVTDCRKYIPQNIDSRSEKIDGGTVSTLIEDSFFTAKKYIVDGEALLKNDNSFISLTVIDGAGSVGGFDVKKGNTLFIPAGIEARLCGQLTAVAAFVTD